MVVLRSAIQIAAQTFCWFTLVRSDSSSSRSLTPASFRTPTRSFNAAAASAATTTPDKPSICTADELHYVSVPNSDWRLALWRYKPPPKVSSLSLSLSLEMGFSVDIVNSSVHVFLICICRIRCIAPIYTYVYMHIRWLSKWRIGGSNASSYWDPFRNRAYFRYRQEQQSHGNSYWSDIGL